MKYGFSKNQLKNACNAVGIHYIQFRQLGIESSKRNKLVNQADYDELFNDYCTNTLTTKIAKLAMDEVFNLQQKYKRIALTCFEANIHQCHRKHLASYIGKQNDPLTIIHI